MKDDVFFDRIEKIKGRLYRIAYSYFNNESKAVDMVDESIYHAYLKKRQLREEEYMETWLVRILINRCKTEYAKYKKHVGIEEIPEEATYAEYDNLPLKDAMERLPEQYRQIVILKYFAGYTIVEISNMLELAQGTVATRMRKALELLRIEMSE